ncbi:MAG: tRNA threonylcarbamoyladenosine dehydratase, partial [Bacteroidales bacterium]|nr:tRNA threonylcarbamoyladenosine dehydratase [Bacteroidales bacterium]
MTERTELLIGGDNLNKLRQACVMVAGLGGVGAFAAEAIVRAGVGKVVMFDGDTVSVSNINRQLIALRSTVGQSKSDIMYGRLKDINPDCDIVAINEYIRDERMKELLTEYKPDWVVDAIDTLSPKVYLLAHCYRMGIKTVSSMGSGGKLNPSLIQVTDISQTYQCPLAHHIRKMLHKQGIYEGIAAVFSPEKVRDNCVKEEFSENKRTAIGTVSYMPAVFGLTAASVVIRELIGEHSYKLVKDTK